MSNFLARAFAYIFGKPSVVEDAFFGKMTDAGSYFECQKVFAPTNKLVDLAVEKAKDGTLNNQAKNFKWMANNYEKIIAAVSPDVEMRVAEWLPNYRISNFKREYELEHLRLPASVDTLFKWEMSFFAANELQHWVSLELTGLRVDNIMIDG